MSNSIIDLTDPKWSYVLGLFQTDGNLSGKREGKGKFCIELSERDVQILTDVSHMIPFNFSIRRRERKTNFSESSATAILTICSLEFRKMLEEAGVPYGKKSFVVTPPSGDFSEIDYYRGVVDGDGSLGITGRGKPYLSLVTASQPLRDGFIGFIRRHIGVDKTSERNKRDGVYNISLFCELAQKIASILYYEDCMCIPRKHDGARVVMGWSRPLDMMVRGVVKIWSPEEDEIVRSNTIEDAAAILGRSHSSVANRRFRLRQVTF